MISYLSCAASILVGPLVDRSQSILSDLLHGNLATQNILSGSEDRLPALE